MGEFIKQFWESQAEKHGTSHTASWGDHFAIDLEIDAIAKHIAAGQTVLDIGCANGFATLEQYSRQPGATFVGVDYAETMVAQAQKAKGAAGIGDAVQFQHADIRELPFEDASFDVTYTTRVLINLPTWEEQQQGIREAIRVTRPGGTIVLSEGFWEPLCFLNTLRQLFGQEPLVEHDFNRYLKKARLEDWLEEHSLSFEVDDFASLYYLGTRVLREVMLDTLPPFGDYNSPVNQLFHQIEKDYSGGGCGIQQAYIIRKPA